MDRATKHRVFWKWVVARQNNDELYQDPVTAQALEKFRDEVGVRNKEFRNSVDDKDAMSTYEEIVGMFSGLSLREQILSTGKTRDEWLDWWDKGEQE